jgi:rare lipoprotein A
MSASVLKTEPNISRFDCRGAPTYGIRKRVRRLVLVIGVMLVLSACGKKVRVAVPPGSSTPVRTTSTPSSSSELGGLASYYAEPYHGRKTANGETFDTYQDLTAAHRTLPFNTVVKVTNESNGRDVEVRINDRGPFIDGRIIDLSLKAAREIDMVRAGVVPVKLDILKEGLPTPRGTSRGTGPPAPSPVAVYTIQVGAFESQDAAEAVQRDLEKRYRDVTVQAVSTPRTFYRVRVGRAPDLAAAEKLSKQLREESFDPFVVRVN